MSDAVYELMLGMQNEINKALDSWVYTEDRHTALQEFRMSMQRIDATRHQAMLAANRGDRD